MPRSESNASLQRRLAVKQKQISSGDQKITIDLKNSLPLDDHILTKNQIDIRNKLEE